MTDHPIKMQSLDQRTAACKSCGQRVRWGVTKFGAKMICQPDAKIDEDGCILSSQTHYAHCPNAKQHKKRKGEPL